MSFFDELMKRNVVRVGMAYVVIAWVLAQIAEFAFENFGAPDWVLKAFVVVLLLGLPLALFFAWAFEITSEGIKREGDVDRSAPASNNTSRRLDFIIIGLMAVAIGYFAYDKFVLQPPPGTGKEIAVAPTSTLRTSIAVLPFDNMSGDPEQTYFSDGMTEEIIGKLAQIDGLRVISRTTVEHHKEAGLDVPAIARELNVGFLLEGSVRKSANRIRVAAQLIQTSDDSHLWADSFDADLDDIFTVQETIARNIVNALGIHLTDTDTEALAQRPTNNVLAYEAYLQGQALVERWNWAETLEASRKYFNQALALDPNYANALAGLASAEAQTFRNIDSDTERLERADQLLDRAQAIDPDLHRAFVARGEVMAARFDYPAASAQFQSAVEVEPEDYFSWDLLCWSLGYETPPRAIEAEMTCRHGLEIAPHYAEFYYHLARALAAQGRFDEAARAIDELQRTWPDNDLPAMGRFWISLAEKDYLRALEHLSKNEKNRDTSLLLAAEAAAYSGMGEPDKALQLLDEAMAKGFRDVAWLTASDHFATTRELPAFHALSSRYGLDVD